MEDKDQLSLEFNRNKNDSNKDLCLRLAYAESESKVVKILQEFGFWNNKDYWKNYGNTENNFATVGNQQSLPEAALVEKIINSVDAMLMAECFKRNIACDSREAPKNITDALVNFFNIPEGKLSNITSKERTELSGNICLVSTGTKSNPNFSIIDKGEGQTPDKIPSTFLSLGESNKLRIPFVQGKFNMGGTGALQFCGKHNLQLIITKRNPDACLDGDYNSQDLWGFTIVRRENPYGDIRSSVYKYLAPDNKILSFKSEELELIPGDYPEAYQNELRFGTFLKLYEYQLSSGLSSNILFDLYNRLSILLPFVAFPVRLYERRKGYSGHSFETTLSGLLVRLDEDKRQNLEKGFPTSLSFSAQGQKMKASVYVFKKRSEENYKKNEGIIFIINGQTHGYISKSFFARKSVGMGYLKDSVLVIVDCSDFEGRQREDLFMNSRDRLRSSDLKVEIERTLEELIRNHQGLRELKEKRRREEISNKLEDSKPLKEILDDILKKSPTLSKLFIDGVRLPNPLRLKQSKESKEKFVGERFPTFFKLKINYDKNNPKNCPINRRFRVQFQTDADNDYFDRDNDPGSFLLKAGDQEISNYSLNLWNGIATLNVSIPEFMKEGDTVSFTSMVNDRSRVDPLENNFYIKITSPEISTSGGNGRRKRPPSNKRGSETNIQSFLDLPNVIEVHKDDWDTHSFDKESALEVIDNGKEGCDFFVNMDNIHLLTELKSKYTEDEELMAAQYKYGMVLIGIAVLQNHDDVFKSENEEELDITEIINKMTRMISPVLIPMITQLGDLEIKQD